MASFRPKHSLCSDVDFRKMSVRDGHTVHMPCRIPSFVSMSSRLLIMCWHMSSLYCDLARDMQCVYIEQTVTATDSFHTPYTWSFPPMVVFLWTWDDLMQCTNCTYCCYCVYVKNSVHRRQHIHIMYALCCILLTSDLGNSRLPSCRISVKFHWTVHSLKVSVTFHPQKTMAGTHLSMLCGTWKIIVVILRVGLKQPSRIDANEEQLMEFPRELIRMNRNGEQLMIGGTKSLPDHKSVAVPFFPTNAPFFSVIFKLCFTVMPIAVQMFTLLHIYRWARK